MNILEFWTNNLKPLKFVGAIEREQAKAIGIEHFRRLDDSGDWIPAGTVWVSGRVYSLAMSYKCVHNWVEKVIHDAAAGYIGDRYLSCGWCGFVKAKFTEPEKPKEPKDTEADVVLATKSLTYEFIHPFNKRTFNLIDGAGMVGFGGIQYETPPGYNSPGGTDFRMTPPRPIKFLGPWIPKKIKFF